MNDRELLDHAEQEIVRVERREGERRKGERRECFKCPACDAVSTSHIIEGRMNYDEGFYWRRHRCGACGDYYTSIQIVEAVGRPPGAPDIAANGRLKSEAKSEAKAIAARKNGLKGGRPKNRHG
jgi:hypothetical protein